MSARAAGYVRVSTTEQARNGLSLEEQQRLIVERAGEGVRLFIDPAMSGAKDDRPQYQALLAALAAGEVDAVYVWKLDRLGRSTKERLRAWEAVKAAGADLISLTEGPQEAKLTYTILAAVAEQEREDIAARTSMGLAAAARSGKLHGRPPLGYRQIGKRAERRWVVDEERAAVVHRIFDRYLDGHGMEKIASDLNQDGVPASRNGAKGWCRTSVKVVLNTRGYLGLVKFKGEYHRGDFEPLISEETWARVQVQKEQRAALTGPAFGQVPSGGHLLTGGLFRCGCCGGSLRPRSHKPPRQHRYECTTRGCEMGGVVKAEIDGPLLAYLESDVFDVEATRQQIAEERDQRAAESRALVEQADRGAAGAEAALARVKADYKAGAITAAEWRELKAEIEADGKAAAQEARQLRKRAEQVAAGLAALDAEREVAERLAALRQAIGAEMTEGNLTAVKAALARLFVSISLVRLDDGSLALVPRLRETAGADAAATLTDGSAWVRPVPRRQPIPRMDTASTSSAHPSPDARMDTEGSSCAHPSLPLGPIPVGAAA